ncbi:hypothetical protein DXG03_008887 [Asterophora parasitica]|uniref:FCP1 homology domain-containing protein n=1 Tax=Asterophora parasitica TaxID=117018 RepID=A0A9P7G420_9AGAR|nr:hypothetical protein DXG03_008887 [Asterophora parasitica]
MPHRSRAEYTGYDFTASAGWDYNYDPSGSRSYSSYHNRHHHHGYNGATEDLDPYTDAYTNPSTCERDSEAGRPNSSSVESSCAQNSCEHVFSGSRYERHDPGYDDRGWLRGTTHHDSHDKRNHQHGSYSLRDRAPRRSRSPPNRTIPSTNPIPTAPSPEYLAESQKTSIHLPTPSAMRKLLILDLNGTLVYRTPHTRKETRPRRRNYHHNRGHDLSHDSNTSSVVSSLIANASTSDPTSSFSASNPFDPYADPMAPRPLRTVHPRPYMPSFRAYVFHPATRAWLDTMVWSSAQPHSVWDMVGKCFPGEGDAETGKKTGLVAVWARDTLGLEEKDYHRKTQTTKDLAKPWAQLSLDEISRAHSAHTTLLLDDSPLKAHLQPWNHLCIREYDNTLRAGDLQSLWREKALAAVGESMNDVGEAIAATGVVEPTPEPEADPDEALPPSKKRKRLKKKKAAVAFLPPVSPSEFDVAALGHPSAAETYNYPYDPTLLAVIGILEQLKWEDNVAGWMRAGGLCAPGSVDAREAVREETVEEEGDEENDGVVSPPPSPLPDASSSSPRSRSPPVSVAEAGAVIGTPRGEGKRRRLSSPSPSPPAANNMSSTDAPQPRDFPPAAQKAPDGALATAATSNSMGTGNPGDSGQWFADAHAFAFWVRAGVKALHELGAEVEHGVRG